MLLASLITIGLLAAFNYYIQHKADRRKAKASNRKHHLNYQHHQHSPFHCVEANHTSDYCNAVKSIEGKRFLSTEAPVLSVKGCDNPNCHCDYIHHEDRRVDDRRTDTGIQHDLYMAKQESRKSVTTLDMAAEKRIEFNLNSNPDQTAKKSACYYFCQQ